MFGIDFTKLVYLALPTMLRSPVLFGMLRAGVGAVEKVNTGFKSSRAAHIFRLTHNGQVCYLRGMLCEYFGPGFRIEEQIKEGEWLYVLGEDGERGEVWGKTPVAIPEDGEGMPVLYSEQELNAPENDFIVRVPAAYWDRLQEVKAMVDKYKLVTKRAHYIRIGAAVKPADLSGGRTVIDINTLTDEISPIHFNQSLLRGR